MNFSANPTTFHASIWAFLASVVRTTGQQRGLDPVKSELKAVLCAVTLSHFITTPS